MADCEAVYHQSILPCQVPSVSCSTCNFFRNNSSQLCAALLQLEELRTQQSKLAVAPAPATKDSVKIKKKVTTIATTSITDTLPEPTSIVVNNKTVAWADLDEELKQEIIESMKEARIAIAEAGRSIDKAEMEATLNAVKAELREAAQELKIQLEQVD